MSGEELRRRREALGLSVFDLAYAFGVQLSSIYRWESGETKLKGLAAVGADTLLRELERKRRARRAEGE